MPLTTDRNDEGLSEILPNGQQKSYIILPDAQRRQFVRPVRTSYRHLACGTVTTMAKELAETYAANPSYYGGTYCAGCKNHFPVGAEGEFVWDDDGTKVGT